MKKIALVAFALICSSSVFAQAYGDLNFFQNQGSVYYQGSFSSDSYTYTEKSSNTEYELEGLSFNNQISYGVLKNLNIFLEANYKLSNTLRVNGSESHEEDGLTNPGVGANYRLLSGSTVVDLFGKFNIRLQDAERGDNRKDGNAYQAEEMRGTVGVALGGIGFGPGEYRLALGVRHNTDGEYTELVNGGASQDVETDSKTDFFFNANYQFRPVKTFMIDLGYKLDRFAEATEKNKSTGSKTVADAHYFHRIGFKAKYQISDMIIASVFTENGLRTPDYDEKTNGVKSEIKRQKIFSFGAGLDLLF